MAVKAYRPNKLIWKYDLGRLGNMVVIWFFSCQRINSMTSQDKTILQMQSRIFIQNCENWTLFPRGEKYIFLYPKTRKELICPLWLWAFIICIGMDYTPRFYKTKSGSRNRIQKCILLQCQMVTTKKENSEKMEFLKWYNIPIIFHIKPFKGNF